MDKLACKPSSVRDLTGADVQADSDILQTRYLSIGPMSGAFEGSVAASVGHHFSAQLRFIGELAASPIRPDCKWMDDLDDEPGISLRTCDLYESTREVPVLPARSSSVKRIDLQTGQMTRECSMSSGIRILNEGE